jgi:hypothetical protein
MALESLSTKPKPKKPMQQTAAATDGVIVYRGVAIPSLPGRRSALGEYLRAGFQAAAESRRAKAAKD